MKKLFQKHVVHTKLDIYVFITRNNTHVPGADPGFQVRGGGGHLKKLRRAEGVFGYFV